MDYNYNVTLQTLCTGMSIENIAMCLSNCFNFHKMNIHESNFDVQKLLKTKQDSVKKPLWAANST